MLSPVRYARSIRAVDVTVPDDARRIVEIETAY
jgi:hypothetical protein